ncbi:MAG: alanine dehydrogenase [Caldilineaceae bacterium]
MNFGVPRELRPREYRVGLTPAAVDALVKAGHQVFVEREAGNGAGFDDESYQQVGGQIVYTASEAYRRAEIVVKVARPTNEEYTHFRTGQTLLSFLQLAVASPDLLEILQEREITAIGYDTIQTDEGRLPVLLPTSEVAGRMAPIIAGQMLQSAGGGRGILLSGIPGVAPATVVIIGAGMVGRNAASAFYGLGADITILDKDLHALQEVERYFHGRVATLIATPYNLAKVVAFADVLVGASSVAGERAPILVTREMVKTMRPRTAIIDFAIDSGGCVETSRPTNHVNPTFVEEEVIHYCVPNVPALVGRTASYALANAVLPYLLRIGEQGLDGALKGCAELRRGVNTRDGRLVHPAIAAVLGKAIVKETAKETDKEMGAAQ